MTVYVYAMVGPDHPAKLDGLTGVGATPTPLRTVRGERAVAVVGDAPKDLRAKRRDLNAHQEVLAKLSEQGTVLPLRFGALAGSEEEVAGNLRDRAEAYQRQLAAVNGKAEYNLRAAQDEDTVVRQVLQVNPEVRRLARSGVATSGDLKDRIALGEAVHADVAERQRRITDEVVGALDVFAADRRQGEAVAEDFLNVSFLVDRSRGGEFAAEARRLSERLEADGVRLRLHGPLPPYSFV